MTTKKKEAKAAMKKAARECKITECDGGWHVQLYRIHFGRHEYVRKTWPEVVAVLDVWAQGEDEPGG